MKRLRILVLFFVILISDHLESQEKYLYFKYDSIPIWEHDSIVSIDGDSMISTIKINWSNSYRLKEFCIENGYL